MEEDFIVDNINIKTLPELIINYLRIKLEKTQINSIRKIYSIILESISIDIADSYLNKIQKYLSSNDQNSILIFDDINAGIYDKNLYNACTQIKKEIDKTKSNSLFYDIYNLCYFIHFEDNEFEIIKKAFHEEDYNQLLFLLFKHAIKNYKISTPRILAERLYNDALTLTNSSLLRKNLYKISANLGHQQAALEYASIISNNIDESIIYYLKAKDLSPALWKLAFNIEKQRISEEKLELIEHELKDIISYSKDNEKANIVALNTKNNFQKRCIIISYKIYFYLAFERNFSKGYNSLGKFFINNKVSYIKNKKNNYEDGLNYLKKAISLGNIHAMQNLAIYYKKNNINEEKIKPLLYIGAKCEDLISCVELSKILISENKLDEAKDYLHYASLQNSPYAQYNLGKIYENIFDYDKAKQYYKNAIKNNYYKASIDLSLVYFQEYINSDEKIAKNSFLINAINILNNYINFLNDDDKKRAFALIEEWNKILDNNII